MTAILNIVDYSIMEIEAVREAEEKLQELEDIKQQCRIYGVIC